MRAAVQGVVALAVLAVLALGARGDCEEEIPLSKVPKKVMSAVKAKYPGADLRGAVKGIEDKEVYYTISLTYKKDELEVSLSPKGEISEVAKEIAVKDLPRAVSEAVLKKYPKATLTEAAEVREPDEKGKLSYHVELTTADKKTMEIELDPKGAILKEKETKEDKK
jgi:hypothetical protein